jgi:hypothetical protein
MLDFFVGLKRRDPERRIRQVLKPTDEEIPDRYEDERTWHGYDVIHLPKINPALLLQHEGLIPLPDALRHRVGRTTAR